MVEATTRQGAGNANPLLFVSEQASRSRDGSNAVAGEEGGFRGDGDHRRCRRRRHLPEAQLPPHELLAEVFEGDSSQSLRENIP